MRRRANRRSPTPWRSSRFTIPDIPTMVTPEELRYLYWLTSQAWSGVGDVLEVGPWLGASTACLAAGMQVNPSRGSHRLHVCDTFVWKDFMSSRAPLSLTDGSSFRPAFESNVASYLDLMTIHEARLPDEEVADSAAEGIRTSAESDITLFTWRTDELIEIAFIDGAKSWGGLHHLLVEIGSHLVPGQARLVCQDYKYWGSYWVPMMFELLEDRLTIEHVLRNNTVTFRVQAPLTRGDLDALPTFSDLATDRGLDLIRRAANKLTSAGDRVGGHIVNLAAARFLCHRGEVAAGREVISDARATWPRGAPRENLRRAEDWFAGEFGDSTPRPARLPTERFFERIHHILDRR